MHKIQTESATPSGKTLKKEKVLLGLTSSAGLTTNRFLCLHFLVPATRQLHGTYMNSSFVSGSNHNYSIFKVGRFSLHPSCQKLKLASNRDTWRSHRRNLWMIENTEVPLYDIQVDSRRKDNAILCRRFLPVLPFTPPLGDGGISLRLFSMPESLVRDGQGYPLEIIEHRLPEYMFNDLTYLD